MNLFQIMATKLPDKEQLAMISLLTFFVTEGLICTFLVITWSR